MKIPTIQELKKEFPHPVQADANPINPDDYCVGGSLCLWLRKYNPEWWAELYNNDKVTAPYFPTNTELANILTLLNPKINECLTQAYSRTILACNDDGDFEAAYEELAQALRENNDETL